MRRVMVQLANFGGLTVDELRLVTRIVFVLRESPSRRRAGASICQSTVDSVSDRSSVHSLSDGLPQTQVSPEALVRALLNYRLHPKTDLRHIGRSGGVVGLPSRPGTVGRERVLLLRGFQPRS